MEGERTIEIAETAAGYMKELAARAVHFCSDKKSTDKVRMFGCSLFFRVAYDAAHLALRLAWRYPELFREIAEKERNFPCLFPAHPEDLRDCQRFILNDLHLGERHPLKVRPARGRKTFSQDTWVNNLLLRYWNMACEGLVSILDKEYDDKKVIAIAPKLFSADNASRWLDVIWKLLLRDIPEPEKHPRLRQLGDVQAKLITSVRLSKRNLVHILNEC